jgi:hypothetical protein
VRTTIGMLVALGLALSVGGLVAAQGPKTPAPGATELAAINTYARQVDRFIKLNNKRRRVFGDVGETDENWREFKGQVAKGETDPDDLDEVAHVWARKGKVVAAGFTFQSESRDWYHFVTYYFREDGTLAKIHSRLNTFYGSVTAIRDQYYGSNGRVLKSTARFLDIQTQKPKKKPNFQDEPTPVYLNVRKLPFFKLLG